jgi:tRNA 5-methylaminomethyl-2-thiouridine biosynthesis bifunctional protein
MTLQPARLAREADGTPYSEHYGDVYASRDGAVGQARHVYLGGVGLPEAWHGRDQFVVLETGFGLGTNFLVTWQAWRADPRRPRRLHFVSVEKHPLEAADLLAVAPPDVQPLAEALVRQWPLPMAGLHRLEFDGGDVCLTLALGDARDLVPQLVLGADAIFLDGFAPDRNPEMWEPALLKAIGRCARPGAALATYTTARPVRDALEAAGFALQLRPGFGRKREMLAGRYAPRWRVRRHEPPAAYVGERSAVIIGAGLAGSTCADALRRRGWQVQIIEAQAAAIRGASALPWGLLRPHYAADDAPLARLTRAGVAAAHAVLARTAREGWLEGKAIAEASGVFQMAPDRETARLWQTQTERHGWPTRWLEAIDTAEAARRVGLAPQRGGLWWPQGAVVSPVRWCHALLADGKNLLRGDVVRLSEGRDGWSALDAAGHVLAAAPVVIVAAAMASPALLGMTQARVQAIRGRVAYLSPAPFASLRAPISGDGYLLRDPDGGVAAGATYELTLPGDGVDTSLSEARALQSNLGRMQGLLAAPPVVDTSGSFDGLRCVARDRLPLAGAVPDEAAARAAGRNMRGAHLVDVPRRPRLFACFALGSRGLTLAPLLAELIAASIEGEPLPIERSLAGAVDPARFLLGSLRRGAVSAQGAHSHPATPY